MREGAPEASGWRILISRRGWPPQRYIDGADVDFFGKRREANKKLERDIGRMGLLATHVRWDSVGMTIRTRCCII